MEVAQKVSWGRIRPRGRRFPTSGIGKGMMMKTTKCVKSETENNLL